MNLAEMLGGLEERKSNCETIAATKAGADRAGWIADANFYQSVMDEIQGLALLPATGSISYTVRNEAPADLAAAIAAAAPELCTRPIAGQVCSLPAHHAGPCFPVPAVVGEFTEPWRLDLDPRSLTANCVLDATGRLIADPIGTGLDDIEDGLYLRRIAACVNACEGASTEELERGFAALGVSKRAAIDGGAK